MNIIKRIISIALLTPITVASLHAATDHKEFVKGPFKSGTEVTKVCLECHEKQASDFMKTTHWNWKGAPNHVKGLEKSTKEYGKANMINAYCTSIEAGKDGLVHEACGKCHAGYGWTRTNYDFSNKANVDCLICHAQKGNYSRSSFDCDIDMKSMEKGSMDLDMASKTVGMPTRKNCGYCHFYGGGGDAVKHAGLDSTLEKTVKKHDVHMGSKASGGQEMSCQACHVTKEHKISGASSMMAHYDSRVTCTDCHSGKNVPHQKSKNRAILDSHFAAVACETCHIPVFAKGQATKMSWNWSDVGKNLNSEEQFDKETFTKKKGSFTWGMNVIPVYAWYNGKIERYMVGDKIRDPEKPVVMTKPVGSISDRTAKLYPYKFYTGDQPMDLKYGYLGIFQQYKSLWEDYNWDKALQAGSEILPYSGKYRFVKTVSYISASHEVAPKEDAVQCGECHMGGKRMNWKELGYKGDPMKAGGRDAQMKKKVKK